MATSKSKKDPFKINVLGLFSIQVSMENITLKQVILIMVIIMMFIIALAIILQQYAIPTLSGTAIVNQIGIGIGKIFKSRSP